MCRMWSLECSCCALGHVLAHYPARLSSWQDDSSTEFVRWILILVVVEPAQASYALTEVADALPEQHAMTSQRPLRSNSR